MASTESSSNAIPPALASNAGFLLNRAARIIREMSNEALKPAGLTVRELGILRIIAKESPITQQMLSERHGTDRTTLVEIIDALEKRQLVVRTTNEQDRRSYLLTMTIRGFRLLQRANKITAKQQSIYLACLSESEQETLKDLLTRIIMSHAGPAGQSPPPKDDKL